MDILPKVLCPVSGNSNHVFLKLTLQIMSKHLDLNYNPFSWRVLLPLCPGNRDTVDLPNA